MTFTFRCRSCEREHVGLPAFGPDAPRAYERLPEAERQRALLTSEQCEIGPRVFLRARLTIPILGADEGFVWLVWVELSERDYARQLDLWHVEGRETEPACPGTLAVSLPYDPPAVGLEVRVHTMPVGQRPEVRVVADHPLRAEQVDGITMDDVIRRGEALLHP